MKMRRVDDDLASISNDRLEFVHAFPSCPQLSIHGWRNWNNRSFQMIFVFADKSAAADHASRTAPKNARMASCPRMTNANP